MANYSGVNTPTMDIPFLFEYPSCDVCTLLSTGKAFNNLGCPARAMNGHPYQSCSHGLDSYVCEYAKK